MPITRSATATWSGSGKEGSGAITTPSGALNNTPHSFLTRFVSDRSKIRNRRVTGNSVQQQREIANAIKNSREMALMPYTKRVAQTRTGRGGRDGGERGERGPRADRDQVQQSQVEGTEIEDTEIDDAVETTETEEG